MICQADKAMDAEIASAAELLLGLVQLDRDQLTVGQLQMFKASLVRLLGRRYQGHWFPDKPSRGSGYRCIRINGKVDPVVAEAGLEVGLAPSHLRRLFPSELTVWVDPGQVSYRIGENGSICVWLELEPPAANVCRVFSGALSIAERQHPSRTFAALRCRCCSNRHVVPAYLVASR